MTLLCMGKIKKKTAKDFPKSKLYLRENSTVFILLARSNEGYRMHILNINQILCAVYLISYYDSKLAGC